jgi:hypothetical protein
MSINDISRDGQRWIRDLSDAPGFPDIDLRDMSGSDRDALVEYLRDDDGSLNEADMEFSREVADEVEALA